MIVMKFGGTSVADADAVARVVSIVARQAAPRVVVVSALAGVTDRLWELIEVAGRGDTGRVATGVRSLYTRHIHLARAVADGPALGASLRRTFAELTALLRACALVRASGRRTVDAILAAGELASSRILAAALKAAGVPAVWVDARRVIVTDARHTRAAPRLDETRARVARVVRPRIEAGRVPVLGGFVGATPAGVTTTLGRGGSDYTAALVGSALGADEIQIWTDVDGLLTADPRHAGAVRLLPRVSFADAAALALYGAKVLHPGTLAPASASGIPIRILNTRRPGDGSGTIVAGTPSGDALAGFASKAGLTIVTARPAPGTAPETLARRAFAALERVGGSAEAIAMSDAGLSIVVGDRPSVSALQDSLSDIAIVTTRSRMALVGVVGERLRGAAVACGQLLAALDDVPVALFSHDAEGRVLGCVIPEGALGTALARLHDRGFGADTAPCRAVSDLEARVDLDLTGTPRPQT